MRKGRRLANKIFSLLLLAICVFVASQVFHSSRMALPIIPVSQSLPKENAKIIVPVTISSETLQSAAQTVSTSAILGVKNKGGSGVNGDWIPGDVSLFAHHAVNGKLLDRANPTTKVIEIQEEKEEFGMNFSAGASTRKKKFTGAEGEDPNDPKTWGFVGLCSEQTGTQYGVASVNFSAIPLPKYLTLGMDVSAREVEDNVYAQIQKDFIDKLKPEQYKNFCDYMQGEGGRYYQNFRTALTYKAGASANSKGANFFEAVLAKCASRAPNEDVGAFAKEWLEEEQGLKTVTYRISIKNNVQDSKIPGSIRSKLIDKGLGALRAYNMGQPDNFAFMWQSASVPKQNKTAAISVSTKILYDKLAASPQKSTEQIKDNYDSTTETTAVSAGNKTQTESSRETILSAILGGMYYVPKEALKGGNNYSMLYFDPNKADPKQTLCDPSAEGSANKCIAVNAVSTCSGGIKGLGYVGVKGDVHVPYINLSTIDTQRWAAVSEEDNVRSYNRAGDMFYSGVAKAPDLIEKATIEQLVALSAANGMVTAKCMEALTPVVAAQATAQMGVNEGEYESLKKIFEDKITNYYKQAFLALPVQVTGKVYLPYINILTGQDVKVSKLGSKEFIPAIYELKLDDLFGGTEALSPIDTNAQDARKLINDALRKQGVNTMTDGKVDCSAGTSTAVTMWPCQTSGYLLAKCQ